MVACATDSITSMSGRESRPTPGTARPQSLEVSEGRTLPFSGERHRLPNWSNRVLESPHTGTLAALRPRAPARPFRQGRQQRCRRHRARHRRRRGTTGKAAGAREHRPLVRLRRHGCRPHQRLRHALVRRRRGHAERSPLRRDAAENQWCGRNRRPARPVARRVRGAPAAGDVGGRPQRPRGVRRARCRAGGVRKRRPGQGNRHRPRRPARARVRPLAGRAGLGRSRLRPRRSTASPSRWRTSTCSGRTRLTRWSSASPASCACTRDRFRW